MNDESLGIENIETEILLPKIRQFLPLGEKNKKILHLGSQDAHIKGAVNIDCVKFKGVDIVADLNKSWAFQKSNSVDGIIAIHVLEHLNYMHALSEICRVLKSKGRVYLIVPYFANPNAHMGEHTIAGFSHAAFNHFSDKNHPFFQLKVILNKIKFGKKLKLLDRMVNWNPNLWERLFCYIIPAIELEVVLEKK